MPENVSICFKNNNKPKLHFYHANGFPLAVYRPFLNQLAKSYDVAALANRATWSEPGDIPRSRDWNIYAEDMVDFIRNQTEEPVIVVGHSMGATASVLALDKYPQMFSAAVLIEPAMVTRLQAMAVRLLPKRVMNRINPARSTLTKKNRFATRQEFLAYIRKFSGYQKFEPAMYDLFAEEAITGDGQGGFKLTFSREWEAHNYTQPPNVFKQIQRMDVPCVALRGKPNLFFSEAMWQQWQRYQPDHVFLEDLTKGHLLPLEAPEDCARLIMTGISRLQS